MNVEQRMAVERKIVLHLLQEARTLGWICLAVNNGGDDDELCANDDEVMENAFAADDAGLYFSQLIGSKLCTTWVHLVLGNDGWDVIADYSILHKTNDAGWNKLMDAVQDFAELQDDRR